MKKVLAVFVFLSIFSIGGYAETNSTVQQKDIKAKILFEGKDAYDERLQQKIEKKELAKKTAQEKKVYKKQDGSIDTFKTFTTTKE